MVTLFQYIKILPGHSSVQDWVPDPSAALQATPLLAGVFAVLALVLSWFPDPSIAAQESPQLDHGVHVSHWQSTERTYVNHIVTMFQFISVTRTFFSARLSSSSISRVASSSIISWCVCCAYPCSFLITGPILCSTGFGAACPLSPCFPLTIHWENLCQYYCYIASYLSYLGIHQHRVVLPQFVPCTRFLHWLPVFLKPCFLFWLLYHHEHYKNHYSLTTHPMFARHNQLKSKICTW